MVIREANIEDIKQIMIVRNSVTENVLPDPDLVTEEDCIEYLTVRGKGWVAETHDELVGFSIADLKDHNIWALFVRPEYEKKGLGRKLHDIMLDWYFQQTTISVWLGTSPNTRAESFYRKAGWKEIGKHDYDEIKFEMTYNDWAGRKQ